MYLIKEELNNLDLDIILVYIQEAHTEDKWPIGHQFKIDNFVTNCLSYTNFEQKIGRALSFRELTQSPYEIYVDNVENSVSDRYQAWPDKYYLVNEEGKVLFHSYSSNYRPSVVDIDCYDLLQEIV